MPPINTPYDQRIKRLKQKIDKRPGQNNALRLRLVKNQQKRHRYLQRNTPQDIPYSSQFESTVGMLNRNLQQTLADIAGRRLATEQQYGFGADQSNPFSVARTLEQNFHNQRRATLNSMARQGQLYAGSLSNARAADRMGFERQLDTAQRQYQGDLGDLAREEMLAQQAYDEDFLAADAQRLESALNQPLDPSSAPQAPNFKRRIKRLQRRIRHRRKGRGR